MQRKFSNIGFGAFLKFEFRVQELLDEYNHIKEITLGLIECVNKVTVNLSNENQIQRQQVQNWAQHKINAYIEDLGDLQSSKELRYPDLSQNEYQQQKLENESNDAYSDKLETGGNDLGRSTIPAGSRKILKLDEPEFGNTTKERLKAKWNPFTHSYENRDKVMAVGLDQPQDQQPDEVSEVIEKQNHNVEPPSATELLPPQNKSKIEDSKEEAQEREDEYADDFEDYVSEGSDYESKNETHKFGQVNEFSLAKLNYTKMREDLSDYSLLLLKNTSAAQEINKEGIVEKRTCALLHTLKKMISNSKVGPTK